jgi:hypothetical protein
MEVFRACNERSTYKSMTEETLVTNTSESRCSFKIESNSRYFQIRE